MENNKQNPRPAGDSGTPDRGTAKKKNHAPTPDRIRQEKRQSAENSQKNKKMTRKQRLQAAKLARAKMIGDQKETPPDDHTKGGGGRGGRGGNRSGRGKSGGKHGGRGNTSITEYYEVLQASDDDSSEDEVTEQTPPALNRTNRKLSELFQEGDPTLHAIAESSAEEKGQQNPADKPKKRIPNGASHLREAAPATLADRILTPGVEKQQVPRFLLILMRKQL